MTPEEVLEREGLTLPVARPPVATTTSVALATGLSARATWAKTVRTGSLLFVAGHGPFVGGKIAHPGKLGADLTVEAGRREAEVTMLNILGSLKAELGELSRIARFVRLLVFVNATPDFTEHHLVAYGATDLLVKLFGDIGRPALAEVGVASLPFDGAVEIEAVVEVHA
jgi:enamine deaminase RidA (YjgF/YER057c/UK114 family)